MSHNGLRKIDFHASSSSSERLKTKNLANFKSYHFIVTWVRVNFLWLVSIKLHSTSSNEQFKLQKNPKVQSLYWNFSKKFFKCFPKLLLSYHITELQNFSNYRYSTQFHNLRALIKLERNVTETRSTAAIISVDGGQEGARNWNGWKFQDQQRHSSEWRDPSYHCKLNIRQLIVWLWYDCTLLEDIMPLAMRGKKVWIIVNSTLWNIQTYKILIEGSKSFTTKSSFESVQFSIEKWMGDLKFVVLESKI